MGIKDLYKVIDKDLIVEYHLSELRGLRVAVDISIFLYRYIRSAGVIRWMNSFILLLCTLRKHGIKAVCIFDGPNPPPEKQKEQQRRREENKKALARLAETIRLRNLLQDKYLVEDIVPPKNIIEECKIVLKDKGISSSSKIASSSTFTVKARYQKVTEVDYDNTSEVIFALNLLIEKLENQTVPITKEHSDMAMEIVKMMGLHAIRAEGEAETVCAYLAVKGKVDAVLTEDTDVLPYGTPLMLAFKHHKLGDEKVVGICLETVLRDLGMNLEEFRDLCILLSCDYNDRVKGYLPGTSEYLKNGKKRKPVNIGVKKALIMINEHRRLEEVCKHVEDEEKLIYERCRVLLTIPDKIPGDYIPYIKEPDYKLIDRYIGENRLTIKRDYIERCCSAEKLLFNSETDEDTFTYSSDEE